MSTLRRKSDRRRTDHSGVFLVGLASDRKGLAGDGGLVTWSSLNAVQKKLSLSQYSDPKPLAR